MILLAALRENLRSFKDSLSAPRTSNNVRRLRVFKPRAHACSAKPHGTFAPLLSWMVCRCHAYVIDECPDDTWSAEF
jgi:hypothetical protein